jgi:hypothetical protein
MSRQSPARHQKFLVYPDIETDTFGDVLDISANPLAQMGDLVDEGDLGGEKGVCGVFDQLGGLDVGE